MLMPSIFGENLFNDDWMNFGFPEVDKALYGKHAGHVMKTDVKETDTGYGWTLTSQDLRRMKSMLSLIMVT